jgi:hypothetical protein
MQVLLYVERIVDQPPLEAHDQRYARRRQSWQWDRALNNKVRLRSLRQNGKIKMKGNLFIVLGKSNLHIQKSLMPRPAKYGRSVAIFHKQNNGAKKATRRLTAMIVLD